MVCEYAFQSLTFGWRSHGFPRGSFNGMQSSRFLIFCFSHDEKQGGFLNTPCMTNTFLDNFYLISYSSRKVLQKVRETSWLKFIVNDDENIVLRFLCLDISELVREVTNFYRVCLHSMYTVYWMMISIVPAICLNNYWWVDISDSFYHITAFLALKQNLNFMVLLILFRWWDALLSAYGQCG